MTGFSASRLTLLREGDTALFRSAGPDAEGLIVAMPLSEHDAPLRRLENEYALRDYLEPSWSAVPQAFVRHNERLVLVLSDPGGNPLREQCGMPWTCQDFLAAASSLVRAVEAMHQRRIVHLDVTPDNILFDPATGRVALCGFGQAALIGSPLQAVLNSGTYAYTAPEVLGGLTQTVEVPADLYALGCLFYELLTGRPPFDEADALSWVHAHMAQLAAPLDQLRPDLPLAVADIVMRLLEKQPARRYASASALLADLSACERMLDTGHAQNARFSHIRPAQTHYGREMPLTALRAAFERAKAGDAAHLVLVSGQGGIGKTALIEAFRAGLMPSQMRFAGSKSERAKQQVPFAVLTEILQGLLRPLLGAAEEEFNAWGSTLRSALGNYGCVLYKLIPDLHAVVGDFSAIALTGRKEREALLKAAVDFVCACGQPGRPVVLFFDDLQWTDVETLEVIGLLINAPASHGVLVVGTYRPSETDAAHPLRTALIDRVAAAREIKLDPLSIDDLTRLIRERYGADVEHAASFARLVQSKTLGNPFFARQFLADLERDGFVDMTPDCVGCRWNLERIRSRDFTDNVADLLAQRLNALPPATLAVLRLLACIGTRSAATQLSLIAGTTPQHIHAALQDAVELDYVRREGDGYVFWHDRLQEAAYATLDETERAWTHLVIARELARTLSIDNPDETIFAAVGQINLAASLVSAHGERRHFARLNFAAALKAREMTAHASALTYLLAAATLLQSDDNAGDLGHRIAFMTAECEFLTNALDAAEKRLAALGREDIDPVLRADLTRLQAALYTTLDRPDTAMQVGFEFLARIGMDVPQRPTDEDVRVAYDRLLAAMKGRAPADLIDHPMLTDARRMGTLNVLADLIPPALFIDVNLMDLLVLKMATESIDHGHTDSCCYAYVTLMFVCGTRFNDYALGYAFGRLAIDLIDSRALLHYKARTYIGFGLYVLPWQGHVRDGTRYIREAFDAAMQTGDMTFAVYCRRNLVSIMIVSGAPLSEMRREALRALDFATAAGFQLVIDAVRAQLALINAFAGPGLTQRVDGADAGFGAENDLYPYRSSNRTIAEFSFWTHRMHACVAFGNIEGALIAQARAQPISWSSRAFVEIADFHFYAALARAAAFRTGDENERTEHGRALAEHHRKLENWAINAPQNFAGRSLLVAAETARNAGEDALRVGKTYDAAIRHAQEQGFAHDEGLANELASNYYADNGLATIARGYLRNARSCYAFWGAHAKVAVLDAHPLLIGQGQSNGGSKDARADATLQLETVAIVKASNALASEIVPERVVETLMGTALAMAGAQTGVLILATGSRLNVAARATLQQGEMKVDVGESSIDPDTVPLSLIQTVSRTLQPIVLDDASLDQTFSHDPCFRKREPRSVFCMPLIKQSRLIAILYLENDLTAGAFVPARTAVLEVLASQAAIALENAHLYADLLEQSRQRSAAEEALRHAQADFERAARLTTMGELVASIVHEVTQPINSIGTSAGAALRWLDRDVPDLGESKQMLRQIVKDSARAKSVVHGLREMAKKSVPSMALFDLHAAIREVLALARVQLDDVRVELDEGVAEAAREVTGDRVQIQQVALNLIMNAIEAMTDVTGRSRVLRIGTTLGSDAMVEVYVSDNGRGLNAPGMERIFEPFFTTKSNGMGMGLVICRSIIQAHGGQMSASSAGDFGTTVRFSLAARAPAVIPS
jgi:predicted ATPase/signal transduction histidine kinase